MNNDKKTQLNKIHAIFGKLLIGLNSRSITVSRRMKVILNLSKIVLLILLATLVLSMVNISVFTITLIIMIGFAICGFNLFPSPKTSDSNEDNEANHNFGSNGSNGSDGSSGS